MCTKNVKATWDGYVKGAEDSLTDLSRNPGQFVMDTVNKTNQAIMDTATDAANWVGDQMPDMNTWAQGGSLIPGFEDDTKSGDSSSSSSDSAAAVFDNPDIEDTGVRRRRSLSRLRRGMYDTIKTSAGGLLSRPTIDVPTLAAGIKTKLGQ